MIRTPRLSPRSRSRSSASAPSALSRSSDYISVFVAVPQSDGTLDFQGLEGQITNAVSFVHANKKKATLTLGGWTGSCAFSGLWSSSTKRTKWAKQLNAYIKQFSLDGLELDWEQAGCDSNPNGSPSDTKNFIAFSQQLRKTVGTSKQLTAAVASDGLPQRISLSALTGSKALNFVNLMVYDIAAPGYAAETAPNAPLHFCNGPNAGSADDSLALYKSLGVPYSRMSLGTPSYGCVGAVAGLIAQLHLEQCQVAAQEDQRHLPVPELQRRRRHDHLPTTPCAGLSVQRRNGRRERLDSLLRHLHTDAVPLQRGQGAVHHLRRPAELQRERPLRRSARSRWHNRLHDQRRHRCRSAREGSSGRSERQDDRLRLEQEAHIGETSPSPGLSFLRIGPSRTFTSCTGVQRPLSFALLWRIERLSRRLHQFVELSELLWTHAIEQFVQRALHFRDVRILLDRVDVGLPLRQEADQVCWIRDVARPSKFALRICELERRSSVRTHNRLPSLSSLKPASCVTSRLTLTAARTDSREGRRGTAVWEVVIAPLLLLLPD